MPFWPTRGAASLTARRAARRPARSPHRRRAGEPARSALAWMVTRSSTPESRDLAQEAGFLRCVRPDGHMAPASRQAGEDQAGKASAAAEIDPRPGPAGGGSEAEANRRYAGSRGEGPRHGADQIGFGRFQVPAAARRNLILRRRRVSREKVLAARCPKWRRQRSGRRGGRPG